MSKTPTTNRLPPFVPLLCATLDSEAWRTMSYGARTLYVALKRRVWKNRNTAFLSYRDAAAEIGCSKTRVGQWYRELEHFGFIVKVRPHALGVDGKGKAALWQLTELGTTSKTSPNGIPEPPTRDFLKWDGTKFKPMSGNGNPATREGHGGNPSRTELSTPEGHSKDEVSTRGKHRSRPKCPPVGDVLDSHYGAADPSLEVVATEAGSHVFPELPRFLRRVG